MDKPNDTRTKTRTKIFKVKCRSSPIGALNDGKTVHKEVPSHLARLRILQVATSEEKDSNSGFEEE